MFFKEQDKTKKGYRLSEADHLSPSPHFFTFHMLFHFLSIRLKTSLRHKGSEDYSPSSLLFVRYSVFFFSLPQSISFVVSVILPTTMTFSEIHCLQEKLLFVKGGLPYGKMTKLKGVIQSVLLLFSVCPRSQPASCHFLCEKLLDPADCSHFPELAPLPSLWKTSSFPGMTGAGQKAIPLSAAPPPPQILLVKIPGFYVCVHVCLCYFFLRVGDNIISFLLSLFRLVDS